MAKQCLKAIAYLLRNVEPTVSDLGSIPTMSFNLLVTPSGDRHKLCAVGIILFISQTVAPSLPKSNLYSHIKPIVAVQFNDLSVQFSRFGAVMPSTTALWLKSSLIHPTANNRCRRKCSKLDSLTITSNSAATPTMLMCSTPQRISGDRKSWECGDFLVAVSVLGIIESRTGADVRGRSGIHQSYRERSNTKGARQLLNGDEKP